MGFAIAIAGIAIMVIFSLVTYKCNEHIIKNGRSIEAFIEYAHPVSSDDSGNTTVDYVLSFENRKVAGREKISTFYASQLQTGETIELMYVNDNKYTFIFK